MASGIRVSPRPYVPPNWVYRRQETVAQVSGMWLSSEALRALLSSNAPWPAPRTAQGCSLHFIMTSEGPQGPILASECAK